MSTLLDYVAIHVIGPQQVETLSKEVSKIEVAAELKLSEIMSNIEALDDALRMVRTESEVTSTLAMHIIILEHPPPSAA